MNSTIACSIQGQGKRPLNEDYIFPELETGEVLLHNDIFIVCDGVGGAAMGEIASKIVGSMFGNALKLLNQVDRNSIIDITRDAEKALDVYVAEFPESSGMATTLAMVYFYHNTAIIVHAGDSRVYQIRENKICFRTQDHSLVREMVANKLISDEEATIHPQRNVISKAIMGSKHPIEPDFLTISDLLPEDYFFICSDGILDGLKEEFLLSIITDKDISLDEKASRIEKECIVHSRDNYSAWLIQIKSPPHQSNLLKPLIQVSTPKQKHRKILIFLILIVIMLAIFFFWNKAT